MMKLSEVTTQREANGYLQQLINTGHSMAVIEQMRDARKLAVALDELVAVITIAGLTKDIKDFKKGKGNMNERKPDDPRGPLGTGDHGQVPARHDGGRHHPTTYPERPD